MEDQPYAAYPRNDIDPKDKNKAWGLLYLKAAWNDWNYSIPRTVFYNAADKYEEQRLYAIGKQPVNKYKKLMGVDEQTNQTFLNLDWSISPFIPKLRDIAISKLVQQEYNIVATPIDPQAKTETDKIYADYKAKIAIRDLMRQQNPELANHPLIAAQPGEPMDMEELEMRIDFGEQFNRSKDAEQAAQLAFYQNGIAQYRRHQYEICWDCGVIGYKDLLGMDNKPRFREVNPEAVVTNYCRFADFRDLIHAGEVIDVSLIDLAELREEDGTSVFSDDQLMQLAMDVAGKWSNPSLVGRSTNYFKGYDKFKVKVLDMQFYSWNDYTFEKNTNRRGNPTFNRAEYGKKNNVKEKYFSKRVKVVYEAKWIIGTDYVYDFGLMKDMKRSTDAKKKAETKLSYKFFAPNFYEMRALSMMERLIPIADQYQMTLYRIQNWKARMVASGWWIDLDSLENIALNKGGENMTPKQVLNMFFETGILAGRSKDVMGNNINYKPILPMENSSVQELLGLWDDLSRSADMARSIVGLNDLTDATTPQARTGNGVADIAVQGTNNSLFPLQFAEKYLLQQLAEDMVQRTQQALRKGNVEGFAKALNSNTLNFMSIAPDISMREYGIMLDERPTEDQRQNLMMSLQNDIGQGFLDSSDALFVLNVYNIKQAQQMLAYKVKKNKQAKVQEAMMNQQQVIQGQQQSAQMTEEAKRQTAQLLQQLELEKIDRQGQWDMQLKQLDLQGQQQVAQMDNQTKLQTNIMDASVKTQQQNQPKPAAK